MVSIGAGALQDTTGIPSAYTNLLEQMGYMNTPFQNVDQGFSSVENFQRSLKRILDQQGQAWGPQFTNNPSQGFSYMPMNLRNIYSEAAPIMNDPTYGIIGAPGMFRNGYAMGDLPGGHSMAYQTLLDQRNVPQIPPPNISNAAAASVGGGGGGGNPGGGPGNYPSQNAGESTEQYVNRLRSAAANNQIPSGPGGTYIQQAIDAARGFGPGSGGKSSVPPPSIASFTPQAPVIGGPQFSRKQLSMY